MNYYDRLIAKTPVFMTAHDFLKSAVEYFKWVDEYPLTEEQTYMFQGAIVRADKAKMRPYTKTGLATFLGMPVWKLASYKDRGEDWAEAIEMIEQVIYTQKFEGAASGLLNATIISRDLGLSEKQELTGKDGGAIQLEETSARDILAGKLASMSTRTREEPSSSESD